MSLSSEKFEMLKRLIQGPLTIVDLGGENTQELRTVQVLVSLGYARDYGQQHGRRIPVRLRIWGINNAGKAAVEQQALGDNKKKQLSLVLLKKPPLPVKGCVVVKTHQIRRKKIETPIEAIED